MKSHEESYKGLGLIAFFHRMRLRNLFRVFARLEIKEKGSLADFGCSNGYIISLLQKSIFLKKQYHFDGFDFSEDLLEMARDKKLPDTEFHSFNLNRTDNPLAGPHDIVLCLETLEHTGNYRNALINLYSSCREGGTIIISIPNEKGVPGIIKFFGRKLLRGDNYEEFFRNASEFQYMQHLILNKPIDKFRPGESERWGPHLGFDWKVFEKHLEDTFVATGKLRLVFKHTTFLNSNLFYVLERIF